MHGFDASVRLAAFRFLEEQMRLIPEDGALPRKILERGFIHEGQRVPLIGPQGIFKPRLFRQIPLSITTVPVVEGEPPPYDDAVGPDGAPVSGPRNRSQSPRKRGPPTSRNLQHQITARLFHGLVPGLYVAEWPVYIVGDYLAQLTFTVGVEERRFASLGSAPPDSEAKHISGVDM